MQHIITIIKEHITEEDNSSEEAENETSTQVKTDISKYYEEEKLCIIRKK